MEQNFRPFLISFHKKSIIFCRVERLLLFMELGCRVCNTASQIEQSCQDIDLYRCPDCDHCFSYLGLEEFFTDYDNEYYDLTYYEYPNKSLFETIFRIIPKNKTNLSVIDLGSGKGDFLEYLRDKDPNLLLTGIDLSPNRSRDNIEFIQGDYFVADPGRQYDVVVSSNSIEHILDVKAFVKRLYDLCLPGGLVVITTINERSVVYETARLLYCLGYKSPFIRLYHKHHVNHFNFSSLERLLKGSRLSVLKILRHNLPLSAIDLSVSSKEYPKREKKFLVVKGILKIGVWGMFLLGRLTGRTFQQTMVAKK